MKILETTDSALRAELDGPAESFAACQCCCVGHFALQCGLTDLRRICNGFATLGGVDDQLNLAVLDGIHDGRPALTHLVDPRGCNARFPPCLCCSGGCEQLETGIDQVPGHFGGSRLINIPDRHERRTLG